MEENKSKGFFGLSKEKKPESNDDTDTAVMEEPKVKSETISKGPTDGGHVKAPAKFIMIQRKISFVQEANASDPAVKEYFGMAYRAIGSYFKEFGKMPASGMTREELAIIMPELTGYYIQHDKRDYNKAITEYFRNINTKIPADGLKLNIALEYEGPLSDVDKNGFVAGNLPQNLLHYVQYRHALGHIEVGANYDEAMRYDHIKFFIEDEDASSNEETNLNKEEDNARIEYYQIINDNERVEQMLVVLGINPSLLSENQSIVKLKEFASIDKTKTATDNTNKLRNFITLTKDKYLSHKYAIEEMVRFDVLERVGMKILIKETGDVIGDDLKGAVVWMNDKGNSREVNVLKARYKEFKKS